MSITGIVVALSEELETLTTEKLAKGAFLQITPSLLVAYSGAGTKNADNSAKQLIEQGVTQLISWGCAAALDPALKAGDLCLPTHLLAANGSKLAIDKNWHQHGVKLLADLQPIASGVLQESLQLVATATEKADLYQQHHCQLLDMESVAVAKVALQHQLPFLTIRIIADTAAMDLPQAVVQALNSEGEVELMVLLKYLICHPFELPALIRLGLYFKAATKTLTEVSHYLTEISQS